MLCNLSCWAPELHGSLAMASLSSYALQSELLGSGAIWLRGYLASSSSYALQSELLGS